MRDTRLIISLLITVIIFSIAAGYTAGFFIYRDYKEKAVYFDRQNQIAIDKFGALDENLKGLYTALENVADENKAEKKELLAKIEAIKEDTKEWEKGYRATLLELKETVEGLKMDQLTRIVENLQDEINEFKIKVQDLDLKLDETKGIRSTDKEETRGVDLGKISVGGQEKLKREQ
jgi:hypothetical protein